MERIRLSERAKASPPAERASPVPRKRIESKNGEGNKGADSDRVYLIGNPHLMGKIVSRGPEQSEVKWANGNTNIVVNTWVAPVKEKK